MSKNVCSITATAHCVVDEHISSEALEALCRALEKVMRGLRERQHSQHVAGSITSTFTSDNNGDISIDSHYQVALAAFAEENVGAPNSIEVH